MLFFEDYNLEETQMFAQRKVYDIWAMLSYLGGIVCAFSTLGWTFIFPFSKVSFQYEAILSLFKV